MGEDQWLAEQFEANRSHLQAVAYRMLGSFSEANDAVQESWLRLSRTNTGEIGNLGGWLTTVTARICLDKLRSRRSQHEAALANSVAERIASYEQGIDPEREALLADSVGLALLVVLNTLSPAERLAFVLHDIFALPFDEIAPIVERSELATRKLASRARHRVQGAAITNESECAELRPVVDAFLVAAREGSFAALLAVLDPDIVLRADAFVMPEGAPRELRGAAAVARQFAGRAQGARLALVDGAVGVVVAPYGRLFLVLTFTVVQGRIRQIEAIADPAHLRQLRLAILDNGGSLSEGDEK